MSSISSEEENLRAQEPHIWKLRILRTVSVASLIASFALTFFNIYHYYFHFMAHVNCWHCLCQHYMVIAIATSALIGILLCLAFPLVLIESARGFRIYLPILFVASFAEFMLAMVFTTNYSAAHDVMRIWENQRSLKYFEVNYKCCGVIGPDDYLVAALDLPKSCYKDKSGLPKDLYTEGCAKRTHNSPNIAVSKIVSGVFRLVLIFTLVVYIIVLKKRSAPLRLQYSLHPSYRGQRFEGRFFTGD
ncbi:uncharacterized protein LOC108102714 [Drosophila eugracilis]|uniref:uncharacterized protein LOC108102714 n=1 Tax=Drosophila eugracilis TaxID=29029 RepID=UPI0007E6DF28|nr:uncharacterized protein LOC108102714 [Drosophila eugracilis]